MVGVWVVIEVEIAHLALICNLLVKVGIRQTRGCHHVLLDILRWRLEVLVSVEEVHGLVTQLSLELVCNTL